MLRSIYTGRGPTAEEMVDPAEILRLANEFKVAALGNAIGDFFKSSLTVDSCCIIYETLSKVDPSILPAIESFICQRAKAVLDSAGFLLLSKDNVRRIVSSKIRDEEIHIFQRVMAWAQQQCKMQGLDPETNLGKLLDGILIHIRFPLMNLQQLSSDVVPTRLLPSDHMVELFTYVAKKAVSKGDVTTTLPYKTNQR